MHGGDRAASSRGSGMRSGNAGANVGKAEWCEHVDTNAGMGGVFGPPDTGFPPTGILAEGTMNTPGWTYAEVDPAAIARVRADGNVLGRTHWAEQDGRDTYVTAERLR